MEISGIEISITGLVQGCGFRPRVANLARSMGLTGSIQNTGSGSKVRAFGPPENLEIFISKINSLEVFDAKIEILPFENLNEFSVAESQLSKNMENAIPLLLDTSPCAECEAEVLDPKNDRFRYAFNSCTKCGPRFTILRDLPFDRERTTQDDFPMCAHCLFEFRDPNSRRFHSQLNSCGECGPKLIFFQSNNGNEQSVPLPPGDPILFAAKVLETHGVIILKGVGGFQLLGDARSSAAVQKIRNIKMRPKKPLAIMVNDLEIAKLFIHLSVSEESILSSQANPIVISDQVHHNGLAPELTFGLETVGVMLPSSPLHKLISQSTGIPLCVTSLNHEGDPIIINDDQIHSFQGLVDGVLTHNREIAFPIDDSVVQAIDDVILPIRLGRGLGPLTLLSDLYLKDNSFALGGNEKNTIVLDQHKSRLVTPHIGDLKSFATRERFDFYFKYFTKISGQQTSSYVTDSHPDYFQNQWLQKTPENRIQIVPHHLAHCLSLLAQHPNVEEVLVFTWDGLGVSLNSELWGGEVFHQTHKLSIPVRVGSIVPFPHVGGDKFALEPRRCLLSILFAIYGTDVFETHLTLLKEFFNEFEIQTLKTVCTQGENQMQTTSIGRLFDGVSCFLRTGMTQEYDSEAAIRLEHRAKTKTDKTRPTEFEPIFIKNKDLWIWDWRPFLKDLFETSDLLNQGPSALKFHMGLARVIERFSQKFDCETVGLTGGVFQNKLLTQLSKSALNKRNKKVLLSFQVPCSDEGLSLGQSEFIRRIQCV